MALIASDFDYGTSNVFSTCTANHSTRSCNIYRRKFDLSFSSPINKRISPSVFQHVVLLFPCFLVAKPSTTPFFDLIVDCSSRFRA